LIGRLLICLQVLALSACGDPLAGIERLSDVELAEYQTLVEFAPAPAGEDNTAAETTGFFGRFLGLPPQPDTSPDPAAPVVEVASPSVQEPDVAQSHTPQATKQPVGLLGWLAPRKTPDAETASTVKAANDPAKDDPAAAPETAILTTSAKASEAPAPEPEKPRRRGVFAALSANTAPVNRSDSLPLDAPLAYGQIISACDAGKKNMGKRIAHFPEKRTRYQLFDSEPGNINPHTFFVTGFADGCPRRFTAALAVFGAPSMHEQLRYGLPSDDYPYSKTDKAYEKLKSRVCGVSRRKPCGAKIKVVERNTVFISTYENFGENARWSDFLIHDGTVVAADLKEG
jgi:hypothetical protein